MIKTCLFALITILATSGSASAFDLTSPDLGNGQELKADQVGKGADCSGGNLSPALVWANPPAGTKSFVVTLFDPDANNGKGFWHWGAFDIPAEVTSLEAGAGSADGKLMPANAVQGKSGSGVQGFIGACPPAGPAHHYIFTVKALKIAKLGLNSTATAEEISAKADQEKLGEATLNGLHAKP